MTKDEKDISEWLEISNETSERFMQLDDSEQCDIFEKLQKLVNTNPSLVGQRDGQGLGVSLVDGEVKGKSDKPNTVGSEWSSFQSQGIKDKEGIMTRIEIFHSVHDSMTLDTNDLEKTKAIIHDKFYPVSFVDEHFVRKEEIERSLENGKRNILLW